MLSDRARLGEAAERGDSARELAGIELDRLGAISSRAGQLDVDSAISAQVDPVRVEGRAAEVLEHP